MQEDKVDNWQAFAGAQRVAIKTALNYQGLYEDNMVYKFWFFSLFKAPLNSV